MEEVDDAIENDDDDDDAFAGVSDIESSASNFEQEENVSSTVAVTATTISTSTPSQSSSGNTNIPAILSNDGKSSRSTSPNEWSVEDVIEFIAETDPALSIYAELFRKHVSYSLSTHSK